MAGARHVGNDGRRGRQIHGNPRYHSGIGARKTVSAEVEAELDGTAVVVLEDAAVAGNDVYVVTNGGADAVAVTVDAAGAAAAAACSSWATMSVQDPVKGR